MRINDARDLIVKLHNLAVKSAIYISTLLVGPPGVGKSSIVEQAAEVLSRQYGERVMCKSFHLTTVEPPDVRGFGLPANGPNGSRIMMFTTPPWAVQAGEPERGILFLDELGQAGHDVQKPAAELLLHRRVGGYQLPPGWIVVAASNREKDRSGVVKELAFITNRRMAIQIEPELDAWVQWAERSNVHPLIIAFAKWKPGIVFTDSVPEKSGPFCTPRSLVTVGELIGHLDGAMFLEAAQGLVGEAATELVAFLRVAAELPSFEQIVANPGGTPVPMKPDACYAAMQMVAHQVSGETCEPCFTYLKRMPVEFQVAGLKATLNRCPEIISQKSFTAWLVQNKQLVTAANIIARK